MPHDATDEVVQQFEKYDTSLVSDALDAHGIDGVITGLEPAHPEHATVGRARPLQIERADSETQTNFPYAMLNAIRAGEVMVIDGVSDSTSHWGGLASRLAENAGSAGIVVNGGFRDVDSIHARDFPVFGAGFTPRSGQKRVRVASTDDPVTIGGVDVAVGDVVVADLTGVVVVPEDEAEAVIETADEILSEELLVEAKIDAGETVGALQDDEHEF